jgi:hypothetical protein
MITFAQYPGIFLGLVCSPFVANEHFRSCSDCPNCLLPSWQFIGYRAPASAISHLVSCLRISSNSWRRLSVDGKLALLTWKTRPRDNSPSTSKATHLSKNETSFPGLGNADMAQAAGAA